MSRIRLVELRAEAYRGFAEEGKVPLDADAVLIRGDNGSGKTCIVDALIWLFTGRLPAIEDRIRGMRRQPDPVLNVFRPDTPARVELDVRAQGETWTFRRVGNLSENTLDATRKGAPVGDGAVALASLFNTQTMELATAVRTWGVLQQDSMRAAIEEGGGALHQRLSTVLGLDQIDRFASETERACRSLARDQGLSRRQIEDLQSRLEAARERVRLAEQTAAGAAVTRDRVEARLARVSGVLPPGLSVEMPDDNLLGGLGEIGTDLTKLVETTAAMAEAEAVVASFPNAASLIAQAHREVSETRRAVVESRSFIPAAAKLADAALPLLGERCPVCDQRIDPDDVRQRLEHFRDEAAASAAQAQASQQALLRAEQILADATNRQAQRTNAIADLEAARNELREATGSLVRVKAKREWWSGAPLSRVADELVPLRDELRAIYADTRELLSGAASVEAQANAIEAELAEASARHANLENRVAKAKQLDEAAHQAADRIMSRALEQLGPSFAEVFDRLSPHPAFTKLQAKQDIFRGRNQVVPEVLDEQRGIPAHPSVVMSEGQLNVVALSYFLGLALNAREGALPFLVLDDPLQSMDVIGVLGFADLARRIREHRQLIITTHDRRFADVLARKLGPREADSRTLLIEMAGWTRSGPEIQSKLVEPAHIDHVLKAVA